MKVLEINPTVLESAVVLLKSAVPEITPGSLVAALKSYNSTLVNAPEKPYKRQEVEVCDLVSVSIPTLYRMIEAGVVRKIIVSENNVLRVDDPDSVREFLDMGTAKEAGK